MKERKYITPESLLKQDRRERDLDFWRSPKPIAEFYADHATLASDYPDLILAAGEATVGIDRD